MFASPKSEAWQRWEEPGWEGVDAAGVKGQTGAVQLFWVHGGVGKAG